MVVFRGKKVRRILHDDEWHFSVVDVIEALTDTDRPRKYWNDLKRKLGGEEGFDELSEKIGQLKMTGADGKERLTDAANTETLFRIVQSIPSKKAEGVKRWLAKTGYERILETQNPDIAIKRAILDYKMKGRSDEWIEARVSSRIIRQGLTTEWAKRGVEGQQYAVLTNLIHERTFDLSVRQHKEVKGLAKHELRDHMTSPELLFIRLGEMSTKDIAVSRNAQGFRENEVAAEEGGQIAGNARKALEQKTKEPVVSRQKFSAQKPRPSQIDGFHWIGRTMAEFSETITKTVNCPDCASGHVVKIGKQSGEQRYLCRGCKTKFRASGKAKGRRIPAEWIGAAIRKYYSGMSYKQIAEYMEDAYDIPEPSKATIYEWVRDYTQAALEESEKYPAHTSGHWVVDEMVLDVGGDKYWNWNVMDHDTRFLLASYLSSERDQRSAETVLRKAMAASAEPPKTITTDRLPSYVPAIKEVFPHAQHIRSEGMDSELNNNRSERVQGTFRDRTKTLGDWKGGRVANVTLTAGCCITTTSRNITG